MLKWMLMLSLPLCGFARAADAPAPAEPDSFFLSYWCGPPAKFLSAKSFRTVKEANFTVAGAPCSGMSVADNQKMLDDCQAAGLKGIISDSRMVMSIGNNPKNKAALDAIIKDYSQHPALFGYFIADEPGTGAFPGLAEVVAYLREHDPKHPAFINLLPTYAPLWALGTKTYEDYVLNFAKIVKPFAISYDNYSLTNHGDRPDFFENLGIVHKVSLETGIPFWNIVLCVQHGDYRNLKEPELRFEAMQTLAYGARGLLWFTYWSPAETDHSTTWKHAMINPNGSKDAHYNMVRRVNAELLELSKELDGAKSTDVFETEDATTQPTTHPADAAKPLKVTSSSPVTVGLFAAPDGKHLALLSNRNYKKSNLVDAQARSGKPVQIYDQAQHGWMTTDAANVEVKIDAGGASLIRW